jgi:hypothetical protein
MVSLYPNFNVPRSQLISVALESMVSLQVFGVFC